tara:strand:- start:2273 stop:2491 length:219 start_codon:yes stop_codon:yes gene_type:complete
MRIKKYGMGKSRTLQEWYEFVGLDMENNKIESRCNSTYDLDKKMDKKKIIQFYSFYEETIVCLVDVIDTTQI